MQKQEKGQFDYLKQYCELVYLDRTEGISTTQIKEALSLQAAVNGVNQIPAPSDAVKKSGGAE